MPDVLSVFAQYGLPGAVTGAMFIWVWVQERRHERDVSALQAQIKDIHAQHKADLKDANATLIAAHADIHEVVDKVGRWVDAIAIVEAERDRDTRGLPPRRPR